MVLEVCNNKRGNGVYESNYGQYRMWTGNGVKVRQWVGAFGVITASQAIEQARVKASCDRYQDRQGDHRLLGPESLPKYSKIDGTYMLCEIRNERSATDAEHVCFAALAREDVASVIMVEANSHDEAVRAGKQFADQVALQLAAAWREPLRTKAIACA
ncbi:hypothetical protein [Rhizomonospora bruguierae]|uniref:hypothetical protein n=1 Tax=Rhizomonospora bruguierae TaxID=1581705 RepID=UPI001BCE0E77|nr:hypothetical protein [Micromonospora sp. NBRC 107566]